MYKVFVKDRPLIFRKNDETTNIDEAKLCHLDELVDKFPVITGEINHNLHHFFSEFKWIVAAGGIVLNEYAEVLVIRRNGLWDLPKGKLEKGESVKTCGMREVEEECGVSGLKIIKELPSTFHTYYHKGKDVLKRTYWYEMECDKNQHLIPQTEEGIDKVEWVSKHKLLPLMKSGYASLHDLILKYLETKN